MTLHTPKNLIEEAFGFELPDWEPRFNLAPSQDLLAVRSAVEGAEDAGGADKREGIRLRWGLVPPWASDLKIGNKMINARSETAAVKPAFREAFRKRRCLVLADGFYEWKKAGKQRLPYYIRLRSGAPFAMAGLWETWSDPQSKELISTCTILTTEANEVLTPLHDRMPVILKPSALGDWLSTETSADTVQNLCASYAPEEMEAIPVGLRVNAAGPEGRELIDRVDHASIPGTQGGFGF